MYTKTQKMVVRIGLCTTTLAVLAMLLVYGVDDMPWVGYLLAFAGGILGLVVVDMLAMENRDN